MELCHFAAWTQTRANKGHFYVKSGFLFHGDQVLGQPVEQLCVSQKYVVIYICPDQENPLLHTAGKTVMEYLTELQSKLKQIHDFADQNSAQEQQRYVAQYNKKAADKEFQVGQQVIVLISDSTKKMVSRWQGPGTILEVKSPHSYLIELIATISCTGARSFSK